MLRLPPTTDRLPAVAVFARAPIPGRAKTRLAPLLGLRGAASLQAALISDTVRKAAGLKGRARPYLFLAGNALSSNDSGRHIGAVPFWPPVCLSEFRIIHQRGKDFGERLENAFRKLLALHPSCVVIGTDSPLFPVRILRQALSELRACDAVLGPCPDGGYYLIALRRPADPGVLPGIFRGVRWSTAFAFRDTLRNLLGLGLSCSVLEGCADVDLPADLRNLQRSLSGSRSARQLAPATWRFLREQGSADLRTSSPFPLGGAGDPQPAFSPAAAVRAGWSKSAPSNP